MTELQFAEHWLRQVSQFPRQYEVNYTPAAIHPSQMNPLSHSLTSLLPAAECRVEIKLMKPPANYPHPTIQSLQLSVNASIGMLKNRVQTLFSVPPAAQRLVYQGKALADEAKCLEAYGLKEAASYKLHLMLRADYVFDPDAHQVKVEPMVQVVNQVKRTEPTKSGKKSASILQPKSSFQQDLHSFLVSQFPLGEESQIVFECFQNAFTQLQSIQAGSTGPVAAELD